MGRFRLKTPVTVDAVSESLNRRDNQHTVTLFYNTNPFASCNTIEIIQPPALHAKNNEHFPFCIRATQHKGSAN